MERLLQNIGSKNQKKSDNPNPFCRQFERNHQKTNLVAKFVPKKVQKKKKGGKKGQLGGNIEKESENKQSLIKNYFKVELLKRGNSENIHQCGNANVQQFGLWQIEAKMETTFQQDRVC